MRHAARTASITVGLAGLAWLIVFALGRSSALESANRTIAEQKERNAAIVEGVYRDARARVARESLKVVQAERAVLRARQQASRALDSAATATAGSMAVLQDSAATVLQLRGALYVQVQTTERVVAEFHEYLRSDSVAHRAYEAERAALYRTVTLADSTIRVKNAAIAAWKKAAECRVLWVKCPTRTQAFVGGAIVTLGVIRAVR